MFCDSNNLSVLFAVSMFLFVIGFLLLVVYCLYLILRYQKVGDKKQGFLPTFLGTCLYLGGGILLFTKANTYVGIVLVLLSVILMSIFRKNLLYLLFSFLIRICVDNWFSVAIARFCFIFLLVFSIYTLKKNKVENIKLKLIPYFIFVILFIVGFGLMTYVRSSNPEIYNCYVLK